MSSLIKYRVHEVAKDFNVPSKEIMTVLANTLSEPKNHMQVLEDSELNIVFEHFTQKNAVESFEEYFATAQQRKPAAPRTEEKQAAQMTAAESGKSSPVAGQKQAQPAQSGQQPARQPGEPAKTETGAKAQMRRVDTKGTGANVNLAKFDERLETLAPAQANKDMGPAKQKLVKKNNFNQPQRGRGRFGGQKRETEFERMKRIEMERRKKPIRVSIPEEIGVGELAMRMKVSGAEVVKKLVGLGVMASLSDIIDYETAAILASEYGAIIEKEVLITTEDRLIDVSEDKSTDLISRSPVVVVMGHVDHGKTSLLDAIRHANVASGEAGGITQHIGAYRVQANDQDITFLDTPGHEAFTAMRARGAQVTDIAILVVAADDGIMPQTIEAINHAKAAGVAMIVAINKMDKEGANPEKIKQQITEHGIVPEDWGGDTPFVEVSAITRKGIDTLLEMVILVSEMRELKANPDRAGRGTVIEAKLDKGRGPVATILVQNGTLKTGDVIIAGTAVGRVRAMNDDRGRKIESAGPSTPVEIIGLSEVPAAGDVFHVVDDEKMARQLVEERKDSAKQELNKNRGTKVSLDDLFTQIQEGMVKQLSIIVKADVQGSVEAIRQSVEKLSNEEVRVKVIHGGAGAINESDIMLAAASNAIIAGFNVRPDAVAMASAKRQDVDVRTYRIIYDMIEEVEAAIKGMLAPKFKETVLGRAEVRQVFKVTGVGTIAGSYVLDGKVTRSAQVRVIRDGIVVAEDKIDSLKRFKDDAKEVATNFECGIGLDKFNDLKEGDIFEAFIIEEVKQ